MSPQRRTALVSVAAALVLIAIKLSAGLATGSLGLISEALHSGTDLVAALLTFFAVGVAVRPADRHHAYGHGKAEHLSALAEAALLAVLSVVVAVAAIRRLDAHPEIDATWWAIAVLLVVIAIDASRMVLSLRVAREQGSAALEASAYHFGSDLAGSTAVLAGLVLARFGHHEADAVAALFVAVLVLIAAGRLIRRNVDVLMDRAPADVEDAARAAIARLEPEVELRRLRMRESGGRQFADVVIGVSPAAAVGQGHAAADAVEDAVQRALPGSDVVVHVEPADDPAVRDRVHAAATSVVGVREVHNVSVVQVGNRYAVSLHLKLPGDLPLDDAHDIAERVEEAIRSATPEVVAVQTHIEPLAEASYGREIDLDRRAIEAIVRAETGRSPRDLRFFTTPGGAVAHLTLEVDGATALAEAHAQASTIEERIRREQPHIHDVIVHTEP